MIWSKFISAVSPTFSRIFQPDGLKHSILGFEVFLEPFGKTKMSLYLLKSWNYFRLIGTGEFRTCIKIFVRWSLKNQKSIISWHWLWKSCHYFQPHCFRPVGYNVIFCIQYTPSLRLRLYLAIEAKTASADLLLVLETNGGFPHPQGLVSARPYSWPAFACWCCFCYLVV